MDNTSLPAPTASEARAALADIDRIVERTRQTIAYGNAAPLMIVWGLIWLVGLTASQFDFGSFHFHRLLWAVLDLAGIGLSLYLGVYRQSPVKSPHGRRIGLSWLLLAIFSCLWVILLTDWHGGELTRDPAVFRRFVAFWSTLAMFAYMVMGLWLGRFYLWLGFAVTLITLAGYWCLPGYFYLWMGVFGGGSLIAAGFYAIKFWR
jgi:hypothetical protein